jgi:predicted metal-dependent hydrolase
MLPPLEDDARFTRALDLVASRDWMEASDLFEELYFEAVRDELPLVRFLLQVSTGMHHVSRGQRRAAVERLEEGLRVAGEITNPRGVDIEGLAAEARKVILDGGRQEVLSALPGRRPIP